MRFTKQHAGKWVAVKGSRVIATDVSYEQLRERIQKRTDRSMISLDLIPKGYLTGSV